MALQRASDSVRFRAARVHPRIRPKVWPGPAGRAARAVEQPLSLYLDLAASPDLQELYRDNEAHDGSTVTAACSVLKIDIEDSMQLTVTTRVAPG